MIRVVLNKDLNFIVEINDLIASIVYNLSKKFIDCSEIDSFILIVQEKKKKKHEIIII